MEIVCKHCHKSNSLVDNSNLSVCIYCNNRLIYISKTVFSDYSEAKDFILRLFTSYQDKWISDIEITEILNVNIGDKILTNERHNLNIRGLGYNLAANKFCKYQEIKTSELKQGWFAPNDIKIGLHEYLKMPTKNFIANINQDDLSIIKGFVQEYNGKLTLRNTLEYLKGFEERINLQLNPIYLGIFKHLDYFEIHQKIDFMIKKGDIQEYNGYLSIVGIQIENDKSCNDEIITKGNNDNVNFEDNSSGKRDNKILQDKLQEFRTLKAKELNLPPYCIFHNTTLTELVQLRPSSMDELSEIYGMGESRIAQFGKELLEIINQFPENKIKPSNKSNDQQYHEIIINCIKKYNGKFGVTYISRILRGSKAKNTQYDSILKSEFYSKLDNLTEKNLNMIIHDLIEKGEILQSVGNRPLLSIHEKEKITSTEKKNYEELKKFDSQVNPFIESKELRNEMEELLFKVFDFKSFHNNQWQVIQKIMNKERVLLIEKTGFGKSLCYQFPAWLFYEKKEGLTLVFSPLIALMRDQINTLNKLNIPSASLNSDQETFENEEILNKAKNGELAILFIAPERLDNEKFQLFIRNIKLSMVVIDEAHCITIWGHDFRPAYKRIINIIKHQPSDFPILALTATATKRVENDIRIQVGKEFQPVRGDLLRKNLSLWVIKVDSEEEKLLWIAENIKNLPGTGLIYTGTQKNTELYSAWLNYNQINSNFYHAGLPAYRKETIEEGLINNTWKCIVTTNALGMGIDKPDIRFIIHTQIPASPIHYYQEIGRAGRDGKKSFIILFYYPEDKSLQEFFIYNSRAHLFKYEKAIEFLKNEPLDENQLRKILALNEMNFRLLVSDLIDQQIINENYYNNKKVFEFRHDSKELDTMVFKRIEEYRTIELSKMVQYANLSDCRMSYLCSYLGDNSFNKCEKCDNDIKQTRTIIMTPEWKNKIEQFTDNYTPILEIENDKFINGIAASYYGISSVGKIIHNCKYEEKCDYPNSLVEKVISAFNKALSNINFDLLLFIPPTESGDLVKNFAEKVSLKLNIPISYNLKKVRKTEPLKSIKSKHIKAKILKNAFIYENSSELHGKNVLIIDDIFDSGSTINEVGNMLKQYNVNLIAPLVIAKTRKGDI